MENVCKWRGGPMRRSATAPGQAGDLLRTILVTVIGAADAAPSADGLGHGEDQATGPVMMALIRAGPEPGHRGHLSVNVGMGR
jgi:hypothetical protein